MMLLAPLVVLLTLPTGHGSCIVVRSDRILAGDLAGAVPEFGSLDPKTPIGFAPVPGARRTIVPQELSAWARGNGIELSGRPPIVCIERPMRVLNRAEVEQALKHALDDDVRVEITGFSQYPVPEGTLEFPLSGLNLPPRRDPKIAVQWLGRVVYGENRHFSVWAQVRLQVMRKRLVAAVPIASGVPIREGQVRLEERIEFPYPAAPETPAASVVGKVSRRILAAGDVVLPELLTAPPAVTRGEMVQVTLEDGAMTLQFAAKADSTGRPGDTVVVENQDTHVKFQGTVEAPDRVVIRAAIKTATDTP